MNALTLFVLVALQAEPVVAQIGGKPITRSALGLKADAPPEAVAAALSSPIFKFVNQRFRAAHMLEVKPTRQQIKKAMAQNQPAPTSAAPTGSKIDASTLRREVAGLEAKLKTRGLSPAEAEATTSVLDWSRPLLEAMNDGLTLDEAMTSVFLESTNFEHALFKAYGGVVVFQQAGPEAAGARVAFIKERFAAGDFTFKDEEVAACFWQKHSKPTPGIAIDSDWRE